MVVNSSSLWQNKVKNVAGVAISLARCPVSAITMLLLTLSWVLELLELFGFGFQKESSILGGTADSDYVYK